MNGMSRFRDGRSLRHVRWTRGWLGLLGLLLLGGGAPARAVYLNVPMFEQCDSQWGSDTLGTCSTTMCAEGCAVTSSAMLFQYYGGSRDPGQLNNCLTNNGGYASGCLIYWTNSCMPAGVSYIGASGDIDTELAAGRPVIAQVHNGATSMHFVVIVGNDNGHYQINDPYWPNYQTISQGGYTIDSIRIYHGTAQNPCDVVVTQAAPTTIDDADGCFVRHGSYWWDSATGIDGHHYYTYAVADADPDCWAQWLFEVQDAGDYEVEVNIPDADADTESARYTVDFGSGTTDVNVNQLGSSGWTSLGTFTFTAGTERSISLFDNTGEPVASHIPVGFDAVRLTPVVAPVPDASVPTPDAATETDGGTVPDAAASTPDASGTEPPPSADGGCNCDVSGGPDAPPALILVFVLLGLAWRRRRSPDGRPD